jgi:2-haloacid dehalogenase
MRVRGVIFDVYGTLFDIAAVATALSRVTDRPEELSRLWRAKQLEYSFVRTLLGDYVNFELVTEHALDYTLEAHDIALDHAQRRRLLRAWRELPLFPDVRPALELFHDAGIPLVILSNGAGRALVALVEQAKIAQLFATVLSSETVTVYKPDPAIYQLAANQFKSPAEELMFVSANGFDIAGARRFGFTVVRVDRSGAPLDRLGTEPHYTVSDFNGLADVILA